MSEKAKAEMEIKAAAYGAAAKLGWQEAVKLLQQAAAEIENSQWRGPGNR